jgi:hypothetical protein
MLVSGDIDLIPPMRLINESTSDKRVFVAFPPNRINDLLRRHAAGDFVIGRKKLADSQFLPEIIVNETEKIRKPITWV